MQTFPSFKELKNRVIFLLQRSKHYGKWRLLYAQITKRLHMSKYNNNIYTLGVFTEKPYSKPLERNVVYIPIITLSHAMSHDFKCR